VNDARAFPLTSGEALEQVDERVGVVARRRVDDESGGLVDDDEPLVLVEDHRRCGRM
jgi:hypothetical protein